MCKRVIITIYIYSLLLYGLYAIKNSHELRYQGVNLNLFDALIRDYEKHVELQSQIARSIRCILGLYRHAGTFGNREIPHKY